MVFFLIFQYGFKSSRVTAKPLTVVFDKTSRVSDKSGAVLAITLDTFKVLDSAWHALVPHKLNGLISSYLSNRRLPMVLD